MLASKIFINWAIYPWVNFLSLLIWNIYLIMYLSLHVCFLSHHLKCISSWRLYLNVLLHFRRCRRVPWYKCGGHRTTFRTQLSPSPYRAYSFSSAQHALLSATLLSQDYIFKKFFLESSHLGYTFDSWKWDPKISGDLNNTITTMFISQHAQ